MADVAGTSMAATCQIAENAYLKSQPGLPSVPKSRQSPNAAHSPIPVIHPVMSFTQSWSFAPSFTNSCHSPIPVISEHTPSLPPPSAPGL